MGGGLSEGVGAGVKACSLAVCSPFQQIDHHNTVVS